MFGPDTERDIKTQTSAQRQSTSHAALPQQPRPTSGVPGPEHFRRAPLEASFSTLRQFLEHKERILEELPCLHGLWAWPDLQLEDEELSYDLDSITKRRQLLRSASKSQEHENVLSYFRCIVTRDIGGIGNVYVEAPSVGDRKHAFNRYTKTVLQATIDINDLFDASRNRETRLQIYDSVCETIAEFGKSATLLSGGGTLGMYHIGVLKTFRKANPKLLSPVISGASAGSIVAAVFASKKDEDLDKAVEMLCHGDLDVFVGAHEKDQGWCTGLIAALQRRSWYDAGNLARVMKDLLGDKLTFKDAFHLTGKRLNITVSTSDAESDGFRLLNHINSPDVVIWSAVVASCAVPFAFPAGELFYRNAEGLLKRVDTPVGHLDGSIYGDVPMDRISREFNVNYFVVSQVNPHVTPFLDTDKTAQRWSSYAVWPFVKRALHAGIVGSLHPLKTRTVLGRPVFEALHSIFHQRYEGDLTIFPVKLLDNWKDMAVCLFNPTHDFMDRAVENGEKEAEKMLPKAHAVLDVEMMLQDLKVQLKTKLKFSKSEEDLHRKEIEQRMHSGRSYRALSRRRGSYHTGSKPVHLPQTESTAAGAHCSTRSLDLGYLQRNLSAEKVAGSVSDSDSATSLTDSDDERSGDEDEYGLRIAMPARNLQSFRSNPPSPIDTRRRHYFPPSRSTSRSSSRSSSPAGPAASITSLRMTPRTPSPEQIRKVSGRARVPRDTESTGESGFGASAKRKLPKSLRNLVDNHSGMSIRDFVPGSFFLRKRSLSSGALAEWPSPDDLNRTKRTADEA